ncbi:MAG: hypothetical protein NZ992_00580 [Candidatus Korarchaeum sp.]|nr:hypothetical protein [Candidatus Korarchaeum sp.]MDW8035237.1 hypothetical protein [Candidatus Korarchaeum sp.]
MKWPLALITSLLIVSLAILKPLPIYLGYQVAWKVDVCETALSIVRKEGYRLLLNYALETPHGTRAELVEECNSPSISYCLIIPGTNPLRFLKVEKG